jgi:hypothetical protein
MKKFSVVLSAALGLALCTAPSAHADPCGGHEPPGDPVFDPGSSCKVDFSVSLDVAGAYALVKGYTQYAAVHIEAPSFLKDSADDGLDAYLWLRTSHPEPFPGTYEYPIASVSGNGATKDIAWSNSQISGFDVRVCVGEGTAKCSEWR